MPFSAGSFSVDSQPGDLMVTYSAIHVVGFLLFAMWSFSRRDLQGRSWCRNRRAKRPYPAMRMA